MNLSRFLGRARAARPAGRDAKHTVDRRARASTARASRRLPRRRRRLPRRRRAARPRRPAGRQSMLLPGATPSRSERRLRRPAEPSPARDAPSDAEPSGHRSGAGSRHRHRQPPAPSLRQPFAAASAPRAAVAERQPRPPTSCRPRSAAAACAPPPPRATRPPNTRSRCAIAEGRGVPQNLPKRRNGSSAPPSRASCRRSSASAGSTRRASGVKKNLETARRLYLAAAEAGNAKAMHNLAVLYAEGIDGKPDYQTAAQVVPQGRRPRRRRQPVQSRHPLCARHRRRANLAEAYKWFTLAAREGDKEAAKKRDDVGARLDQQTLMAARAAAQAGPPSRSPRRPSRSRRRPAAGTPSRRRRPPSAASGRKAAQPGPAHHALLNKNSPKDSPRRCRAAHEHR